MRVFTKRLVAVLFPLILFLPAVSILLPVSVNEIENRRLEPPEFTVDRLLDTNLYRETLRYVQDANPVRTRLIRLGASLDFWVFDDSPNPLRVFKGRNGWLFFRRTIDEGCSTEPEVVVENLKAFVMRLEEDIETVVLTIAPSKYAIHPEGLTADQFSLIECARANSERLRQLLADATLEHYVDGWALFERVKNAGIQPYFRTDTHFNFEASIPWMEALIDEIAPIWDPSAVRTLGIVEFQGNLMSFIGLTLPERVQHVVVDRGITPEVVTILPRDTVQTYRVPEDVDVALIEGSAVIIGDSFMILPGPSLVQYFREVTVFDWQKGAVEASLVVAPLADIVIIEVSEMDVWSLFADQSLLRTYSGTR
jgi:hypothetical protein